MRTKFPTPQADYFFVIQPSDSVAIADDSNNALDAPVCCVYYGGAAAANVAVIAASDPGSGTSITFQNVQPGSTLPIGVRKVMSTNTTAAAGTLIGLVGKNGF
jgi:hypothetical protein